MVYVFGDADQIRRTIEAYLFSHDLDGLKEFSKNLTEAISNIAIEAERLGAKVIFAGGDDVLFYSHADRLKETALHNLMKAFEEKTGSTLSIGVGKTPEEAFTNLAKAKASGRGVLYYKDTKAAMEELTKRSSGRKKPRR